MIRTEALVLLLSAQSPAPAILAISNSRSSYISDALNISSPPQTISREPRLCIIPSNRDTALMKQPPTRTLVAEFRKKRGIPAAELARRVGISRQTIYAIEDGTYIPKTTIALQLARILEVRVEDLFTLERSDTPVEGSF